MNQSSCETLVAKLIDHLQQGDVQAFCDVFIQDAELIMPDAYCMGRDAIFNAVTLMHQNLKDIEIQVTRLVQVENLAFIEWHWQDTNISTGKPSQADTIIVVDFEDDKIQRWREYWSKPLS